MVNEPLDGFDGSETTTANQNGFQFDAADTSAEPAVDSRDVRLAGDVVSCLRIETSRLVVQSISVTPLVVRCEAQPIDATSRLAYQKPKSGLVKPKLFRGDSGSRRRFAVD